MTEIPKAPITRIVKSAGAERISKEAETCIVEAVEDYTRKLAVCVIDLAGHADRKTVLPEDVELALKHF